MSSLKLLIVEDDVASLELMSEVYSSLKAEVRPLSNSEEAELLVNREKFDGIFLDLEMPRVNGFQLADKIRKSSWNKSPGGGSSIGSATPSRAAPLSFFRSR